MRIPVSKMYRAFPELDPFPDHECRRFVRRARRRVLAWMWVPVVGLLASFAAIVAIVVMIITHYEDELRTVSRWLDRCIGGVISVDYPVGDLAILVVFLLAITVGPWLAFALPRDALIRRAIAKRIEIAECTGCEHSLIGLPLLVGRADPAVRCPECGREMVLSEIGLIPDDLLARAGDA